MISQFVYSILLRASVPLFGVVNFMMIVRMFDEGQVGVWVLYMTILALIEVTKNGFIKGATILLLNKQDSKERDAVLSSSLMLNVLITFFFIFLIAVATLVMDLDGQHALLMNLLLVYCIQLLVHIPFSHFDYFLISQGKFKQTMIGYLVRNFTFFLFLIVTFFWFKEQIRLEYLVGFQAAGILTAVVFLRKFYPTRISLRKYNSSFGQKILSFGKYVFATNASSMLFRSTDHYMLAGLINTASVAYYNVALRITNLVDLPSTAAAEVIFPMSTKTTDKGELKVIYEKAVGYILAFVIPVSVFIFLLADPIIFFIAGENYSASTDVLKVTLVYGLFLPFLKQFGTMVNALDRPKINFMLMFGTFLINIGLNYAFISRFGLLGAAYGTLATYVVSLIVSQVILKRLLNIDHLSILKNIFGAYVLLSKRLRKSPTRP